MANNISSSLYGALCILLLTTTSLNAQQTGNVEPVRGESTSGAVNDDEAARYDPAGGFDDLRNRDTSNYRDSDGYIIDGGGKRAKPVIPQGDWSYGSSGRTSSRGYAGNGSGNDDYVRFETSDARFNTIANFAFNNPGACIAEADHRYLADRLGHVCGPKGSYNATLGMICTTDDIQICR